MLVGEAKAIGRGGIAAVARATGASRNTIQAGLVELSAMRQLAAEQPSSRHYHQHPIRRRPQPLQNRNRNRSGNGVVVAALLFQSRSGSARQAGIATPPLIWILPS